MENLQSIVLLKETFLKMSKERFQKGNYENCEKMRKIKNGNFEKVRKIKKSTNHLTT